MSTKPDYSEEEFRPKTVQMRSKKDRELEAEKIRQDFVRTNRTAIRQDFQEITPT